MRVHWTVHALPVAEPTRLSRSTTSAREVVQVGLTHEDRSGYGEAGVNVYFGQSAARICELLKRLQPAFESVPIPEDLLAALPDLASLVGADLADELAADPGVLAAVDSAVHDLVGQRADLPVFMLAGQESWQPVRTARTIGLRRPADAAAVARRLTARGVDVLKVKVGASDDLRRVAAVRGAAPRAKLLLDPNGAWQPEQAARMLDRLARYDVAAVEQPVPPGTPDQMAWLSARSPIAVIADEDATSIEDIARLAGAVHGVNIQLPRLGGITSALAAIEVARRHGTDVMLGCGVSSSLGIAPAAHLTGYARWVDLDGHLMLAQDPWTGIGGEDGTLRLTKQPGLGVQPAHPSSDDRVRDAERGNNAPDNRVLHPERGQATRGGDLGPW
jgi:L-alanine-DL-glutamate epimerase-like enolase superfamily enzyme